MVKFCKGFVEEFVKCFSEFMCVKVKICNIMYEIYMDILILFNLIFFYYIYSLF